MFVTRPSFVQKEHERIKHVQVPVFLVCVCLGKKPAGDAAPFVAHKGRELKKAQTLWVCSH